MTNYLSTMIIYSILRFLLSLFYIVLFLKTSMENKKIVEGFLKIGYKKLFYRDMYGKILEMKPLCVLDFYVHESCQRTGIGKLLFEFMLDYRIKLKK